MKLALFGWVSALSFAVLATTSDATACAGCRNPSMPTTQRNIGPLDEQQLRVGASVAGTSIRVVHEAGCADLDACDEVPAQPVYLHDQDITPVELRLAAEYGFSRHFGVDLQVPLRVVVTSIEYTTPDGAAYDPLDAGVHHRDETVAGLADPWLLGRVGGWVSGTWLAARAGLSIPLGSTEEDPFALGDRGLRHQHIQLGTGTFDPMLILEVSRPLQPAKLQAFLQGQLSLYDNAHGYRAPVRLTAGAGSGLQLSERLRGFGGLEIYHETEERWGGEIRQDGNLGRTELQLALGLTHEFGDTELACFARFPLYRRIIAGDEPPGSLESPLSLMFSIAHAWGSPSP